MQIESTTGTLVGKRVIITRPEGQSQELCDLIRAEGGIPLVLPSITIVPPDDWSEVNRAISDLSDFDWVLFTSANGVRVFLERMRETGHDYTELSRAKLGVIGPATARELERWGLRADLVPDKFVAEGLLDALIARGVSGKRFLLPRAAGARAVLSDGLRRRDASVRDVALYRADTSAALSEEAILMLRRGEVAAITFTSSSTVRGFLDLVSADVVLAALDAGTRVVCIGPITEQTARESGLPVHGVATEHTAGGLVEALAKVFELGS